MAKTSSPRTKNGSGQTRGRGRPRGGAERGGAQGNGRANGVVEDYGHTDATTSSRPKRECRNKPVRYRSVSSRASVESDNPSDDDSPTNEADRAHEDEDEDEHELAVYEIESRQSSSEEPDSSDDETRPNNKGKVTADMTPEEFNERLRRSKWGHVMEERRARADKEIELEQEEMAKEYDELRKQWEERDRKDEEERQRKAKLPKLVVNGVTLRYNEEDMRQLYEEEIAPREKPPQWQNGKLLEPEPDPEPISWKAFLERQAEWHVRYPQPSRTPSREGSVVDSDATSGRSSPSGGVQENNLVVEESGEEGDDEDMEALLQRAQRKRPRSQRSSRSRESSTLKRNRNQSESEPEEDQEENNGEAERKTPRRTTKSKSRTPAGSSVPPSERSRGGSRNGSRMSVEEQFSEHDEGQEQKAREEHKKTARRATKSKSRTPMSRGSHTPAGTSMPPSESRSQGGSRNGNRKSVEEPALEPEEDQSNGARVEKRTTPQRSSKAKSRTPRSRESHTPVGTFVSPFEIRSRGGSRMSVQQPYVEPTEDQEENAREKNERTSRRASKAESQTPRNRGSVTPNGASVRLSEGRSRGGSRMSVQEARHEFEHEDQEAHIQESDFEFEYPVDGPSHPPESNDEEFAVPEAVQEEEVETVLRRNSTRSLNRRSDSTQEVPLGVVHSQAGPAPRESSEARRGRLRYIQGLLSTNRVEHLEVRVAPPRRTRDDSYFEHLRESMPLETAMKQNSKATEKYLRARMAEEDEAFFSAPNLSSSSSSKRKGQPQQEARPAKSRKRRQEPPSPADQDNSPPQVHSQSPPLQQSRGTAPARQEEKCQYRIDQPHVPAPQSRPISVARTIKEEPVPDQDGVADDRDVERIADPGYKTRDVILPDSGNKDWNRWTTVDLVSWIRKVLDGDPDVEDFCRTISQEKYRGHGFFNLLLNKDNMARVGIPEGWLCELRARAEVVKLHWEDMKNWERRNKRKH